MSDILSLDDALKYATDFANDWFHRAIRAEGKLEQLREELRKANEELRELREFKRNAPGAGIVETMETIETGDITVWR